MNETLTKRIWKRLTKPMFAARLTTADFRRGKYRITLYDDDVRPTRVFDECSDVQMGHYDIAFRNEIGMYRRFVGSAYSVEEIP